MSLTPELIEQERIKFSEFIHARKTSTILPYIAIWIACTESKQAEIGALKTRTADLVAEKDADTILMKSLTARIRDLEKDAARLDHLQATLGRFARESVEISFNAVNYTITIYPRFGDSIRGTLDRAMESKV